MADVFEIATKIRSLIQVGNAETLMKWNYRPGIKLHAYEMPEFGALTSEAKAIGGYSFQVETTCHVGDVLVFLMADGSYTVYIGEKNWQKIPENRLVAMLNDFVTD